jgi:hypothetical protein
VRPQPLDFAEFYRTSADECLRTVLASVGDHAHGRMGAPQRVLDPAAGRGEFITAVPAAERWACCHPHHC